MCLSPSANFQGYGQSNLQEILGGHNAWRANVSSWAPAPRTPLVNLQWDNDLAKTAARWAAQCRMGHDDGSARALPNRGANGPAWSWVGQNICYSWGYSMSWTECINSWASERKDWQYGIGQVGSGAVGHLTQMIWEDTKYIGCGRAQCTGSTEHVLVCNYGPGGNFGSNPYARPYVA